MPSKIRKPEPKKARPSRAGRKTVEAEARRNQKCSACGAPGHNRRSCVKLKAVEKRRATIAAKKKAA